MCIFSPFDAPKADFQLGFRLSGSSIGGCSICGRVSGPSRGWIHASGAGMTEGVGGGGVWQFRIRHDLGGLSGGGYC